MAERRTFSKSIIESDDFLNLSFPAQSLYLHLAMNADDDGFINNPQRICHMVGSGKNDMDTLFEAGFVIPFNSGIVVITHWKIHNYIQKDRYKPSQCNNEKAQVCLKNGMYCLSDAPQEKVPLHKVPAHATDSTKPNFTESFARFWSAYPKKVGKGAAEKVWKRLRPDENTLKKMLSALEWQKESSDWMRDKGQYIPHPATWLNGRRWEDERPATAAAHWEVLQ